MAEPTFGAKATPKTAAATQLPDPLRIAATAFLEAYGEHLNHHCPKCTQAWAALRDALETAPPR